MARALGMAGMGAGSGLGGGEEGSVVGGWGRYETGLRKLNRSEHMGFGFFSLV